MPGPGEGCMLLGGPGGAPRDGYCWGRYASYWNAFLLVNGNRECQVLSRNWR